MIEFILGASAGAVIATLTSIFCAKGIRAEALRAMKAYDDAKAYYERAEALFATQSEPNAPGFPFAV